MSGSIIDYIDVCSLCDLATETIQKHIENGNYEGAHIHLCAYLLEIYSRYQCGEIDADTWHETLSFYRRMTTTVIEECNLKQQIQSIEKENEK